MFLIRRQQADAPNHCSISNNSFYVSFMVLLQLQCPSGSDPPQATGSAPQGAPLRYAVCHTACSSAFIRHGSSCVLHATSFITSSVTLHFTSLAAWPFALRLGSLSCCTMQVYKAAQILSQTTLQYSLGSITLHYGLHSLQ